MAELPPTADLGTDIPPALVPADVERIHELRRSIEGVIRGKTEVVELTLVTLFAQGHLLIEDVPGVGKTMLAQALTRSLDASFRRIQFTSDLLPSDIVGVSIYQPQTGEFEFKPGPIFTNVLLADEINRATPKTQSAMLEAMNEAQVSIDSRSYPIPQPFIVLATQNPIEHQGTYPLPESQLDRFLMRVRMGYPSEEAERALLEAQQIEHPIDSVEPVMTRRDVVAIQHAVRRVRVDPSIVDYLVRIAGASRRSDKLALGVSPRGNLLLQRASQARALLEGRDFVVPDDVQAIAAPVLSHRVIPRGPSAAEPIVDELLSDVAVPL
jgi:MoxR-like ATPase